MATAFEEATLPDTAVPLPDAPDLSSHGILAPVARARLRAAAMRDAILPGRASS